VASDFSHIKINSATKSEVIVSDSIKATESSFEKASKRIALVLSILAFALSLYNFVDQHFVGQHVLKAAVVSLQDDADTLKAKLLLINEGKNVETLYSARFLFAGNTFGKATLGPITLKPGESRLETLSEPLPTAQRLRDSGVLKPNEDKLHIAVEFLPITRDGKVEEDGTIYGFTEWKFSGDAKVGASPIAGDQNGLVDLKL
jgi:hypothetical protein